MSKLPIFAVCALSLSAFSSSVYANNINYDYMEVGYSLVNDSGASGGFTLSGSYDVYENVNAVGNLFISTTTDKSVADNIDANAYTIGLGYHYNYSTKMDFFAEALLLNTHSTATKSGIKVNKDDTGYVAAVGVRSPLNDKVELLGRIERRNSGDLSETVFTFGGLYKYSEKTALGLKLNTGAEDGSEALTASIRWNY
jgi:hypothetical protein